MRLGRPNHLQFSEERLPFPRSFAAEHSRAQALHFFANHELLAIELMALCLLKFPNAPIPFQKGLVHTITEEQEHLRCTSNVYKNWVGKLVKYRSMDSFGIVYRV